MTAPHLPILTYSFPFYPAPQKDEWNPIRLKFESGAEQSMDRWSKCRRHFHWVNPAVIPADHRKYAGFFTDRKGGGQAFYIDNIENVYDPYDAPVLDSSGGGGIAETTYYVAFTYSDGTNETQVSEEGSKLVLINNYLTITTPSDFPTAITEAKLYIGTSSGSLFYSGIISVNQGTWTQDDTLQNVDANSNSGQKVLNVDATAGFQVGNTVYVNEGGARAEICVIASIQAGTSLTMEENLAFTHTGAQADVVETQVGIGDAVPSSNTLEEEIHVMLEEGFEIEWKRVDAYHYFWNLKMVEVFP